MWFERVKPISRRVQRIVRGGGLGVRAKTVFAAKNFRVGLGEAIKLHDSCQKALAMLRPTGNQCVQQRVHVI